MVSGLYHRTGDPIVYNPWKENLYGLCILLECAEQNSWCSILKLKWYQAVLFWVPMLASFTWKCLAQVSWDFIIEPTKRENILEPILLFENFIDGLETDIWEQKENFRKKWNQWGYFILERGHITSTRGLGMFTNNHFFNW